MEKERSKDIFVLRRRESRRHCQRRRVVRRHCYNRREVRRHF